MRLIAHIAGAEQSIVPQLPLDREHVLLGVGNAIADGIRGDAGDGNILRPVEARIGMAGGRVQWRKGDGKILAVILSAGSGYEGVIKQWGSGTAVGRAVR